jgi:hypothetical protein
LTYPSGRVVDYTYTDRHWLHEVKNGDLTPAAYAYNPSSTLFSRRKTRMAENRPGGAVGEGSGRRNVEMWCHAERK